MIKKFYEETGMYIDWQQLDRLPEIDTLIDFFCNDNNVQNNANIGKIQQGISQINNKAKYVDPPPKPILEYKIAVIKKNIVSIIILKIYDCKYSFINCNRYQDN